VKSAPIGFAPFENAIDYVDSELLWKRQGGGRSESEQEQQIRRSKQNIARSFLHAK
jgi:hypothetical protein